jgi:hypothetical protein
MRLFKRFNKKAQEAHTGGLGDLVHILLVVLLILLLFYLGYRFINALFGSDVEQATESNFDSLADNIQLMIDKPSSFEYQTMIFYLDKEYSIRGFTHPGALSARGKSPADYPSSCQGKSCLCLYDNYEKKFPAKPVKCRSFEQNIVFLSVPYSKDSEKMALYADKLALDYDVSQYQYFYLPFINPKIFNLYVEKLVKSGQTTIGCSFDIIIMATPYLSSTQIDTRVSLLATCPLGSDPACVGKRRNYFTDNSNTEYCYFNEANQSCSLKIGLKNCAFDQKLTADCLCGDKLASRSAYTTNIYCFDRADGKAFILPFNCKAPEYVAKPEDEKCLIYCEVLTQSTSPDCVDQEQYYCNENPCGFGTAGNKKCETALKGQYTICRLD